MVREVNEVNFAVGVCMDIIEEQISLSKIKTKVFCSSAFHLGSKMWCLWSDFCKFFFLSVLARSSFLSNVLKNS